LYRHASHAYLTHLSSLRLHNRTVIEPEHRVDDFIKAGADILSVHPESTLQLGAVINKIDAAGVAPGVVLNPGTPVSAVEHVLDQCRVAVVMLVRDAKDITRLSRLRGTMLWIVSSPNFFSQQCRSIPATVVPST